MPHLTHDDSDRGPGFVIADEVQRGPDRFRRRGRSAVRTEWRVDHHHPNLLKLYRHARGGRLTAPAARSRTAGVAAADFT